MRRNNSSEHARRVRQKVHEQDELLALKRAAWWNGLDPEAVTQALDRWPGLGVNQLFARLAMETSTDGAQIASEGARQPGSRVTDATPRTAGLAEASFGATLAPWDMAPLMNKPVTSSDTMAVQRKKDGEAHDQEDENDHEAAVEGVRGPGEKLPYLQELQQAFSNAELSSIRVHTDSAAAEACRILGARAYARGEDIAFDGSPDLHTVAHEVTHVIQQRQGVSLSGGFGREGDAYERHADAVADTVVSGKRSEALVDQAAGSSAGQVAQPTVQRVKVKTRIDTSGKRGKKKVKVHRAGWKDIIKAGTVDDGEEVIVDFDEKDGHRIAIYDSDGETLKGYVDRANVSAEFWQEVTRPPGTAGEISEETAGAGTQTGDRGLKAAIVAKLKLEEAGRQDVTTYGKTITSAVERTEAPTVLYTPREPVKIYHGTKTEHEASIQAEGLDPAYGGGGGAAGLTTEPFNAKGYVYYAIDAKGAEAAAFDFFQKDGDGSFTVFEVTIGPETVLVQDPDLGSAVRTARHIPGESITVYARYTKTERGKPRKVEAGASGGGGAVQSKATGAAEAQSSEDLQRRAQSGVSGSGGALPHLATIQAAFGSHDISGVQAHTSSLAAEAAAAIGARAYATGNDIAFGGNPDLHTAAHEAAHVVQQRAGVSLSGGVGAVGDRYEQHADAVADLVVQGESAEGALTEFTGGGLSAGVQQQAASGVVQLMPLPAELSDAGRENARIINEAYRDGVAEKLIDRAMVGGAFDLGEAERILAEKAAAVTEAAKKKATTSIEAAMKKIDNLDWELGRKYGDPDKSAEGGTITEARTGAPVAPAGDACHASKTRKGAADFVDLVAMIERHRDALEDPDAMTYESTHDGATYTVEQALALARARQTSLQAATDVWTGRVGTYTDKWNDDGTSKVHQYQDGRPWPDAAHI